MSEPEIGVTAADVEAAECSRWWWWLGTAAVVVPMIVAALRSAVTGWVPIGDSAYFTARSLDVGGPHTPLIGAWSSGSLEYARPINSLGALEMYLLAPFTHVNPDAGTAIGVAAVQVAAVSAAMWLLVRNVGRRRALAGVVGVSWLVWAIGSENVIAAVQHPYLILPFAACIVAVWAVLVGDLVGLYVLIVFGSLCAQTHLSYPLLIGALLFIVTVAVAVRWRAMIQSRAAIVRTCMWAFAIGLVLWTPPLIDQFFGSGNLLATLTQGGGDDYPTGWGKGARIVASVVADPGVVGPQGYVGVNLDTRLASSLRGAVVVGAAIGGIGATIWMFRRWRYQHRWRWAWCAVLTTVMFAMLLNASLIPGSKFGYRVDNYRWLWSWLGVLAVAVWMGIDAALSEASVVRRSWKRAGPPLLTAVLVVAGLWNLVPRGMPNMAVYRAATADVAALSEQLGTELSRDASDGPVVIDDTHLYFGAPYNYPLAVVLQRHGVPFRFPSPLYGYRFGTQRVADGTEEASLTVWVRDQARQRRARVIAWSDVLEPVGLELVSNSGVGDG